MTEQTKTCHMCGEQIKAIAKRCPHCTQHQSKFNSPIIIFGIVLALIIVTRFLLPSTSRLPNRETIYGSDNKLVILETTHKYSKDDCGSFITILGKLRNDTEKAWNDVHFEVKFYNDKAEQIDTFNSQLYSLVVAPKKEASFRIREKAAAPADQYKRYDIRITKAQEDFKLF